MTGVVVGKLPRGLGPSEAYARLRSLPGCVLFESTDSRADASGHSFVAADPFAVVTGDVEGTTVRWGDRRAERHALLPLTVLGRLMERFALDAGDVPDGVPFPGGAAGWLSYELGFTLEELPPPRPDYLGAPLLRVGLYDVVLTWDHARGEAFLVSTGFPREDAERGHRAGERLEDFLALLSAAPRDPGGVVDRSTSGEPARGLEDGEGATLPVPGLEGVTSTFSREAYQEAVERIRRLILRGDIFQANLSQRFQTPWRGDPLDLHRRLGERHPSAFAVLLEDEWGSVVSASPERFLRIRDGRIETRPIKGTAPRSRNPDEDAAFARALEASDKDRAENVMIVDLLRNDLSRVCSPGTVRASRLCSLESHPTVHHLVSVVEGRLEPGVTAVGALKAAFPGGSITGAPKIRAMEMLRELEPTARGVYTGSLGWIGFQGDADLSIAIRTIRLAGGTAYVHAGGGVVLDSDPAAEWHESVQKVRGLLECLAGSTEEEAVSAEGRADRVPMDSEEDAADRDARAHDAQNPLVADSGAGAFQEAHSPRDGQGLVLLLDHEDSFVHVLARYVRELGSRAVVLRANRTSLQEIEELEPSHLILSPGPRTPLEAGVTGEAIRAFAGRVPILGVCLGHLCISHALGGEWSSAVRPLHGRASAIRHHGDGIFRGLPDPFQGARYHSLALKERDLPDGLEVVARSDDGEVMAVADPARDLWGVQFHPESVLTEGGHALLRNFLALGRLTDAAEPRSEPAEVGP